MPAGWSRPIRSTTSPAPAARYGDGSPFFNTAAIFDSHAFGDVTVGATSVAGGFVGAGDGLIANSTAFGNVLRRRQQRARAASSAR